MLGGSPYSENQRSERELKINDRCSLERIDRREEEKIQNQNQRKIF